MLLWFLSFIFRLDAVTWDDKLVDGLHFVEEHVLQIPLFLMTMMRYITPTLDNMWGNSWLLFWASVTDRTQVHGLAEMGGHDKRAEAQA